MAMRTMPLTLKDANELVAKWHRHHKPVLGHRFSVGCVNSERMLVGAAICGRPVARGCDPTWTLEVSRLVTNGTRNACSYLYAVSARIAKEMGFTKIQTYILESESGTSLKAAGWELESETVGGDWNNSKQNKGTRRTDQPTGKKQRWVKILR